MANDYSSSYGKMWKDGDYLYFPLKEIFAEEDAKELIRKEITEIVKDIKKNVSRIEMV